MIVVIEACRIHRYAVQMRSLVIRLLALIAVMLMPFGMSALSAEPAHHEHSAAVPMNHCPEPDQAPVSNGAVSHCTMACAAALPATDLSPAEAPPVVRAPIEAGVSLALSGIELEIATPPPRLS